MNRWIERTYYRIRYPEPGRPLDERDKVRRLRIALVTFTIGLTAIAVWLSAEWHWATAHIAQSQSAAEDRQPG